MRRAVVRVLLLLPGLVRGSGSGVGVGLVFHVGCQLYSSCDAEVGLVVLG